MILLTKDHLTRDTKDKITSCYNKAVIKATSIYDLCYIDRYIYIYIYIISRLRYIPFMATISEYLLNIFISAL